jgi:hypothetical protein
MKPLLSDSAPLYLKRLARELNSLPDGFYLQATGGNVRCMRAVYRKGHLSVIPCGETAFRYVLAGSEFTDAYGRTVVASRSVK